MSRYSRKPPVQPRPAAPKPEPTIPEGKTAVSHIRKPGWVGYIWETPWNLSGHADVVWIKSPINATTEKPEPLSLFPQRYPLADLIEQSTHKQEGAISGEIWGQGGVERGAIDETPQQVVKAQNLATCDEETGELIRVVNRYHVKGQNLPNLIVAMQTEGHPLGNPFYREAKSDRAGCVRKFKQWLWQRYQEQGSEQRKAVEAIADLVMQGEQVNLACCCKQPDVFVACHCDEIKKLLEKVVIPQRLEVAA